VREHDLVRILGPKSDYDPGLLDIMMYMRRVPGKGETIILNGGVPYKILDVSTFIDTSGIAPRVEFITLYVDHLRSP
jgi:hypothetical protein